MTKPKMMGKNTRLQVLVPLDLWAKLEKFREAHPGIDGKPSPMSMAIRFIIAYFFEHYDARMNHSESERTQNNGAGASEGTADKFSETENRD